MPPVIPGGPGGGEAVLGAAGEVRQVVLGAIHPDDEAPVSASTAEKGATRRSVPSVRTRIPRGMRD